MEEIVEERSQMEVSDDDYNKRQTGPGAHHGVNYQLHQLMYHAFISAFSEAQDFEIHTEDAACGDYDDLVVISDKGVIATQYKHELALVSDPATLSDFVSQSGNGKELMLYKYFASIYSQIINDPKKLANYYCLYSNREISTEMMSCLDENGRFKKEFYLGAPSFFFTRNLIIASIEIYAFGTQSIKLTGKDIAHGLIQLLTGQNHITDALLTALFKFEKNIVPHQKKNFSREEKSQNLWLLLNKLNSGEWSLNDLKLDDLIKLLSSKITIGNFSYYDIICASYTSNWKHIKTFLEKLIFKFGQENVATLKEQVKNIISDKFHTHNDALYHAFFYEFYDWLISPRAEVITRNKMELMFNEWYNKYIYLERLSGLTKQRIFDGEKRIAAIHYFEREEILLQLQAFISTSHVSCLALHGDPGMGKSTLVYKLFASNNPYDGQYLFINVRELIFFLNNEHEERLFDLCHMSEVELICIDDAEQITYDEKIKAQIIVFINQAKELQKKIILLFRTDEFFGLLEERNKDLVIDEKIQLQPLTLTHIIQIYPFLTKIFPVIDVATEAPLEESADLNFDAQIVHLQSILTVPFFLRLIVEHQHELQKVNIRRFKYIQQLKNFIIYLAIERPSTQKEDTFYFTKPLETKIRKSLIRQLAYAVSKESENYAKSDLFSAKQQEILNSLVAEGIISFNENGYRFAHLLYEEWAVTNIVRSKIKSAIESRDKLEYLLEVLERLFPNHLYLWENLLRYDKRFLIFLIKGYSEIFLKNADLFVNLANIAIRENNSLLLDKTLSHIVYSNEEARILLLAAIEMADLTSFQKLVEHGMPIVKNDEEEDQYDITSIWDSGYIPDEDELRMEYEASSDNEDNWYALSEENEYHITPWKYCFRAGRIEA
jgi:GTPase SAR1 family protein